MLFSVLLLVGSFACSETKSREDVSRMVSRLSDSEARALQFLEQAISAVAEAGSDIDDLFLSPPSALISHVESGRGESSGFLIALSNEISERVCAQHLPAEISAIVYVMSNLPGTTSVAAIDCIVDRYPFEDHLLWTTITAWRRAGFPTSAGITSLRERAQDSRTSHRLLSLAELTEWKRTHVSENVIQAVESSEL